MKNASLMLTGILILGGLGWFLATAGGEVLGTDDPPSVPPREDRASGGPDSTASIEPYVPPGLPSPEPKRDPVSPATVPSARVESPQSGSDSAVAVDVAERDPKALVERDQAIALDASLSLEDRVRAIRNLNSYKIMDELEGRTPEVLQEAFWILDFSDDVDVREDLLQGLQGLADHSVVPPLVRILRADPEAQVREAAAEVLLEHVEDASALAALREAARVDLDEDVREVASKAH